MVEVKVACARLAKRGSRVQVGTHERMRHGVRSLVVKRAHATCVSGCVWASSALRTCAAPCVRTPARLTRVGVLKFLSTQLRMLVLVESSMCASTSPYCEIWSARSLNILRTASFRLRARARVRVCSIVDVCQQILRARCLPKLFTTAGRAQLHAPAVRCRVHCSVLALAHAHA
eukprot:1471948-Pleurochrysis_carterae.AAC.3